MKSKWNILLHPIENIYIDGSDVNFVRCHLNYWRAKFTPSVVNFSQSSAE